MSRTLCILCNNRARSTYMKKSHRKKNWVLNVRVRGRRKEEIGVNTDRPKKTLSPICYMRVCMCVCVCASEHTCLYGKR
jgi:hypothetical protein